MAFGGFFGGGGSSSSDNNNSSSSDSSSSSIGFTSNNPHTSSILPLSSPSGSPSDTRQRIQTHLATQANIANAKYLISKVNENCFAHCIPNPGPSLSSKENQCLSSCMEKYIEAWNVTSRTYVGRLQKEGAMLGNMSTGPSSGL